MKAFLIVMGTGLFVFLTGILCFFRERKLFANSVTTEAEVVAYYDYNGSSSDDNLIQHGTMYTMAVEYVDEKGNKIHAREQSGSTHRKYRIGDVIQITYSLEKTDFFIVTGNHSRMIIFVGMIIVGVLMMGLLGPAVLKSEI